MRNDTLIGCTEKIYLSPDCVSRYFGTDHLGSTTLVTDEEGEVVSNSETTPFGDQSDKSIFYTGKMWDEDAELYYFNARWYDPETGRFITEDPVRDGLNWYLYCSNNPINYVDPTGLGAWDIVKRNTDNLISIGFSTAEIVAGVALTAAGVSSPVGVAMIVNGSLNIAAQVGKIAATTVTESNQGTAAADNLDKTLPDSFIGMAAYGVSRGNEKAGAVGDLIDVGVGLGIGAASYKAVDVCNDVANSAAKLGQFDVEEAKVVTDYLNTNMTMQAVEGVAETIQSGSAIVENSKQVAE